MDCLSIEGGRPLSGSVAASGAKNAALPIMAASLLVHGPVRLARVPRLTDVAVLGRVLRGLGSTVEADGPGNLILDTPNKGPVEADGRLTRRMRASFCVIGPLLARRGRAVVALPGGCRIGPRPIDLHLAGLAALGADIRIASGFVMAQAKRLRGATIQMTGPHGPTVTGTANILCAATTARGTSRLVGAAREPEIVDLGRFLIALGAQIDGLGTDVIEIRGVEALGSTALAATPYEIIPDRIEAATLLLAGAITGGRVRVTQVCPAHLASVVHSLAEMNFCVTSGSDWVELRAGGQARAVDLIARPYPGLPTDVQAQFTAVLALAQGQSVIRDQVFPHRFQHARELVRMGARFERCHGALRVTGVPTLSASCLTACDLRASAALMLAALAAPGRSLIFGLEHLDRGYEALGAKLSHLGGVVARLASHSHLQPVPLTG